MDLDDLVTGAHAAALAGISRQRWQQLKQAGKRPRPAVAYPRPLWDRDTVIAWAKVRAAEILAIEDAARARREERAREASEREKRAK